MNKTGAALLAVLLAANAGMVEAADISVTGTEKLEGSTDKSYALSGSGKIVVDAGTAPDPDGWAQVNELTGTGALEFQNGWVNADDVWHPFLTVGNTNSALPTSTLTLSVSGNGVLRYISDGHKSATQTLTLTSDSTFGGFLSTEGVKMNLSINAPKAGLYVESDQNGVGSEVTLTAASMVGDLYAGTNDDASVLDLSTHKLTVTQADSEFYGVLKGSGALDMTVATGFSMFSDNTNYTGTMTVKGNPSHGFEVGNSAKALSIQFDNFGGILAMRDKARLQLAADSSIGSLYSREADTSGILDLNGHKLTITDWDDDYWGTLKGAGDIHATLLNGGGGGIYGDTSAYMGNVFVSGKGGFGVRHLPRNLSLSNGASLGAEYSDASVGGSLALSDNSYFGVLAAKDKNNGTAGSISVQSVTIGSNVQVALARMANGGTLAKGSHIILKSQNPISGAFAGVTTAAGILNAQNLGMPMLDAKLDQQSNQVILNVSMKTENIASLPVSAETKSLLSGISAGNNENLYNAVITATTEELQSFSSDMDHARGAIAAAGGMAVNTAGPSAMSRLDSLGTGGAMPVAGGFMPFSSLAPVRTGLDNRFALSNVSFDHMRPAAASPYASMMAQAVGGSQGVTNGVWARPVYWFNKNSKDGSRPASEINGLGFVAGYDVAFGPATVGASYGYSHAKLDMAGVDGEMDDHTVGLYGSANLPAALLLKGWAGYSWQSYDVDRRSSGLGLLAGGKYNRNSSANAWTASLQLSRPFDLTESVKLTPFVGLNAAWVSENGYTEKVRNNAAPDLALQTKAYSDTKVFSTLGADLTYVIHTWNIRGRLGWNARLSGETRAAHSYRLTGVDWQETLGTRVDDNSATLGLAVSYHVPSRPDLSFYGGYDGTLGNKTQTHSLTAGVRFEF